MHRPLARRPSARDLALVASATVTALVAALLGVGIAAPAQAADRTIAVTSTADADPNDACTTPSMTDPGSPVTLRAALCVASNLGGSTVVTVPNGTFTLADGAIGVGTTAGTDITIQGASTAGTVLVGAGTQQLLTLDPLQVGGIAVTIDKVTMTGGVDNVYGGGAIIGGSGNTAVADSLVISASSFSGNSANTTSAGSTANPGGAVQFIGGSLDVRSTSFSGNSSGIASGGAVYYQATGATSSERLSIQGSTFSYNRATASGVNGGAAVAVSDPHGGAAMSISSSTFTGNAPIGNAAFAGAGLWLDDGALSVTGSAFVANTNPADAGSAIAVTGGTLSARYNRIAGNSAPAVKQSGGTADFARNWWGCGGAPASSGCDTVSGAVSAAPYLTLGLTASQATLVAPQTTTTLTASLLADSAGASVAPSDLTAFEGAIVDFGRTGTAGSVSPVSAAISGGVATSTLRLTQPGSATASATLGAASATTTVVLSAPPAFTTGGTATGVVGAAGTFTVSTTGYPTPALSLIGSLPTGVGFVDNGDGTATISGTPMDAAKDYPVTVRASNAGGTVDQAFTYVLNQTSSITSPNVASFTAGSAGSFTVTATGRPTPDPITLAGALPSGLTFTDNHDGTATIAGTPSAKTGGVRTLSLTAGNGVGAAAAQTLTLTVQEAPVLTSSAVATATVGQSFSFTVTTDRGYPVPAVALSGTLPTGLGFVDNGDGTGTVSGTPTDSGGVASLGVTASNGVAPAASGDLTLTVRTAPAVTTAPADQKVVAGAPVVFTAAASGFPAPTAQWSVSTDGGASYAPITGATATSYGFTAAAGDGGNRYRVTFENSAGSVSADATLSVGTAPAFSSAAGTTFLLDGAAHSFAVTTTGFPNAALSASGLPAWLTLTDNGDKTGTLAGTPPAGSAGVHTFTLTASNSYQPDATQTFALTVAESPAITSAASAPFTAGAAGSFTVTTSGGFPGAVALTAEGALPQGVRFTDAGDGTAVLSGTPAAGSGGAYSVQVTADNGVAPATTQTLTIVVAEAAVFTGPSTLDVTRGVDVDFGIATGPAYPAVSTVTLTGALPAGLTFTAGPDGTARITGSTTDAAATSTVTLTAVAPGSADVTRTLTVVVADAPTYTLPLVPPTADGALAGVPSGVQPGQTITLVADGFASDSPVTFGLYSVPVTLGVVDADAQGTARLTVVIPAGYEGAHTLVALGTAPDGSERVLRTDFVLPTANGGGSGGSAGSGSGSAQGGAGSTSGSGGSGLADTGLDATPLLLLALGLLGLGAAMLVRRRARA
ncbi:beta strand repeat-containing protein [Leifsonia aquatica]|uniref:beta strand repeat-containing protein n=1 Tax=Leifsonia aquatica TaxID=144185 RepID=UPI0028A5D386|nr:putative Ig domain-containing protein [Leifsonia aquatica]